MAVIRKKRAQSVPSISTASLPDVIFMILFFFMVSTTMRRQDRRLVVCRLPEASQVQRLEKRSAVSYIYIGEPMPELRARFGSAPRIQLNDSFRTPRDIGEFIASERDRLSGAPLTVCIKADVNTRMGIITDVKQELRRADARNISYAATRSLGYR
ncbi:biopolymer transporter ExbD [Bacteroidia bacterium]|nr:biopolymer transporter ExbD [Bacteroidia bacterium]